MQNFKYLYKVEYRDLGQNCKKKKCR